MNYFEIGDPYYALIKAKNDEEAVQLYIDAVAGDSDDFESLLEECEVVPEYYAAARFAQVKDNGRLIDLEEVVEMVEESLYIK